MNKTEMLAKYEELKKQRIGDNNTYCDNCNDCNNCNDCYNCYDCNYCDNCNDCYMCVGLKDKQYCILNEQYTKEEYEAKIKELED